jgi:hypothetical protein
LNAFAAAMAITVILTWARVFWPHPRLGVPGQAVFGDYITQNIMLAFFTLVAFQRARQSSGRWGRIAWSLLVVLAVVYALMGLYYLLAGKVTGNPVSFRQGLAITAWSSLPVALGALVAIVAVFTSSPQSTFESMQLLNVDPLLVQLPIDHPWSRLAKSFSLLNFWAWFLAALCWKTWFRTGWGQAVFVVILPSLVIYGGMAALAAF